MSRSLGFKPYASCKKPVPLSDPYQSCLKCLGEAYTWENGKICESFRPWTKKDWDIRLRVILMELALRLASESRSDSAPSTSASAQSAPGAIIFLALFNISSAEEAAEEGPYHTKIG